MSRQSAFRKATSSSDQQSPSSTSQKNPGDVQSDQPEDLSEPTGQDQISPKLDSTKPSTGKSGSVTNLEKSDLSSARSPVSTHRQVQQTDQGDDRSIVSTFRPSPSISNLLSESSTSDKNFEAQQQQLARRESDNQDSRPSTLQPTSQISNPSPSSLRASQASTSFQERSNIPITESSQSFYPSADPFSRETQFSGPSRSATQQSTTDQELSSDSYAQQAAYQHRLNRQKSTSRPSTGRRHSLSGMSRVRNGRKYRLVVVQHPERARMCGFGDKDRRPLSPSLIVKLIVTDAESGNEISPWEVNSSLFFLAADLCHPDDLMLAPRNLLIHQHATSVPTSSVQGSSSSSAYPIGDQRRSSNPGTIPMTSIRAPGSTYDGQQSFASQSTQEYPSAPSASSPSLPSTTRNPPPPPSRTAAISSGMDPAIQYPYHAAAAAAAAQRSSIALSGESGSSGGSTSQQSGQQNLTTVTMEHYTRNLVGAAVTSANVLRDEDDQFCIFFVLQDLSVRTEGVYRIRLVFTDLAQQDGDTVEGVSDALAEAYTDTFTVYSPRRFPGMLEPTELSKKLASQGVKIAVRSDKKKRQRGADQEDSGLSWPSDIRGLVGPGTSGSGGGGSAEGGDGEGDEGEGEDD